MKRNKIIVFGAYVPVLPERAREECNMSLDVPKSDNIARGLGKEVSVKIVPGRRRIHQSSSSHVRSTLPGFRSRCNIDLSCLKIYISIRFNGEKVIQTKKANPSTISRTSS